MKLCGVAKLVQRDLTHLLMNFSPQGFLFVLFLLICLDLVKSLKWLGFVVVGLVFLVWWLVGLVFCLFGCFF